MSLISTPEIYFCRKNKKRFTFEIDQQFRANKGVIIPFPQRTVWRGPDRITQFGDGIVGAGEIHPSTDEENGAV